MISEDNPLNNMIDLANNIPNLGATLKAAREKMNLSVKDAAIRLHLSAKLIENIEQEDFENGLPAIFMRGYIRSYAKILNLDTAVVETAITQLNISVPVVTKEVQQPVTLKIPTERKRSTYQIMRWSTYLVIALLLTLVVLWWNGHSRYRVSDVETIQTITPSVAETAPVPALETQAIKPAAPIAEPAPQPQQMTPPTEQSTAAAATTTPASLASVKPEATPEAPTPSEAPKDLSEFKMATSEPGLEPDRYDE